MDKEFDCSQKGRHVIDVGIMLLFNNHTVAKPKIPAKIKKILSKLKWELHKVIKW